MPVVSKGIFIIGGKRTPFCQYSGPLRELPACHAFAAAAKDAIHTAKLDPALIDETVVGNIYYLSQCDGGKTPRYCGIYSGVPIEKPALGVSKACGTGLQAIISGAVGILFGTSNVTLTGGTDIMSSLPMLVRNVRFGTALGVPYTFEDHVPRELVDSYSGLTLAKISKDLAKRYNIDEREIDEYAGTSHLKWKSAQDSKAFADEITSLTVNIKKKEIKVGQDQPTLSEDQLKSGTNSSSPADGAAALLLASDAAIKSQNLSPLARITGWSYVGTDPKDTGITATLAVKRLLDEHKFKVEDIDLFEINESYASQVLVTAKELNIPLERINVNGGSLAIGHPVSATGARMTTNLVYELRRRNLKRGVATSSCGGGQGIAIMLETL